MLFVFFVLAGFSMQACICEKDSSYYIVEMPETSEEDVTMKAQPQGAFKVYWNAPTMQCKSKNVPFDNLSQFGIIQNEADKFRQGDKMTILYDPGFFPALFNSSPGTFRYRNGGVPQEGNIQKHLDAFNISVEEAIPNKEYNGIAVIDFESWKPIFNQNYGTLKPYIDVSYNIERKEHWWWPQDWIKNTAQERYERAGKTFMESTLKLAKKMRPKATWGYYAYPYCYNRGVAECSAKTMKENDRLDWLWNESTGIFPSIYTNIAYTASQLELTARGAVAEAARVAGGARVLPYISYVYRDRRSAYYKESDLEVLLDTIYNSNADGVVVWGASSDVNTKEKCELLLDYITTTFGPMIEQFTRGNRRRGTETTTNTPFVEHTTITNEITTENNTLVNKTVTVEQTETSLEHLNEMENVSDFFETANRVKQDSVVGDNVMNSVIQFFDIDYSNNTLNESSENPEVTENPDDTPGFTQIEIEQAFKAEANTLTDNSNFTIYFKRYDVGLPISSPFENVSINWRKINATTPIAYTTNTINEIVIETSTENNGLEFYTSRSHLSTDINKNHQITTEEVTTPQERIPDKSNSDRDGNEILESLTVLTGSLEEHYAGDSPSVNKTIEDEELANASKILQDLTDYGNNESNEHTYKTIVDNNHSNNFKNFYDFATIEDNLDSPQDSKTSNKYGQEVFDDDTVLEAVADILNSTDRTEVTSS